MLAPVLIPTCNRLDKLRICLKSLQENTLAIETVLYISVDFPPNVYYESGHSEVVNYLKKAVFNFKKINIYYQEKNLGVFNNLIFLKNEARKDSHQKYIITEDDNEFSIYFLEYINWGLDVTKNSPSIMSVCGFSPDLNWTNKSPIQIINNNFCSWGYGIWANKDEMLYSYITENKINVQLYSFKGFLKIIFRRTSFIHTLIKYFFNKYPVVGNKGNFNYCDISISIAMVLNGYRQMLPTKSLVFNNGNDGSGLNCKNKFTHQQKISNEKVTWDACSIDTINVIKCSKDINFYYLREKIIFLKTKILSLF